MNLWKVIISTGPGVNESKSYTAIASSVTAAIAKVIRNHEPEFERGIIRVEPTKEGLLEVE